MIHTIITIIIIIIIMIIITKGETKRTPVKIL
jgi:hypothetical protein